MIEQIRLRRGVKRKPRVDVAWEEKYRREEELGMMWRSSSVQTKPGYISQEASSIVSLKKTLWDPKIDAPTQPMPVLYLTRDELCLRGFVILQSGVVGFLLAR